MRHFEQIGIDSLLISFRFSADYIGFSLVVNVGNAFSHHMQENFGRGWENAFRRGGAGDSRFALQTRKI